MPPRPSRRRRLLCNGFLVLCVLLGLHAVWLVSSTYRGWTAPWARIVRTYAQWRGFTPASFRFAPEGPPDWLRPPAGSASAAGPLQLRIAVVSVADEFAVRTYLREWIYNRTQVPGDEVQFELKFFIGRHPRGRWFDSDAGNVDGRVLQEAARYGDVELVDAHEGRWSVAQKRFAALKWAASVPPSEYDFFFTVDSDSFVRLAALARKMRYMRPDLLNPRTTPILWGDMMYNWRHWRKSPDPNLPDEQYAGDWYQFPVGIGYLMSSALAARLNNVSHLLAHNVPYYSDDVAVGSWISEHAPETIFITDRGGFHDPPLHGQVPHPIEYGTVLIHHLTLDEMRYLRAMQQWEGEWLPVASGRRDTTITDRNEHR